MKRLPAACLLLLAFTCHAQLADTQIIAQAAAYINRQAQPLVEFIPGDDDPRLFQDRLRCIEGQIPLAYNDKVHAFINYFTVKDREYTKMVARRMSLYFPMFERTLKEYGLPEGLKYLSIIESGLNPRAVSRAHAVGLWQFVSATGRHYGLSNSWYVDERMDPEKSTRAACHYLRELYSMFGDWELAIAAYNTGPGNVKKAIRRSGYKHSFWEIYPYLARETRSYLPQFVAITYAMNYLGEHNFYDIEPDFVPLADTIKVNGFVNLTILASLTGTCLDDIQKLNPEILRNTIPEGYQDYPLRVTTMVTQQLSASTFDILDSASHSGKDEIEALARNAPGNTYGRDRITYRVKSGDVLGAIALRYHVRISDLREWNRLSSNTIRIGQVLSIWVMPGNAQPAPTPQPAAKLPITAAGSVYIVQPGDTLWDISQKYEGLTIEKIKSLNNLNSNKIVPGQKLLISI